MTIREEFSKTKGRLVPLFYSGSYEIIKQWLAFVGNAAPEDPFFNRSYGTVQTMLKRIGSRAGIPSLHAHQFRHSSATYYANQGWNEFQMNKRYGWSYKSDMGREYVEQSKIDIENSKRVKEYESRQLGALEGRLRKQEAENRRLREEKDSIQTQNTAAIRELEKRLTALMRLTDRLEEINYTHKARTSQSVE